MTQPRQGELRVTTKNVVGLHDLHQEPVADRDHRRIINGQALGQNSTWRENNPENIYVLFNDKWSVTSRQDYIKSTAGNDYLDAGFKAGGVAIDDAFKRRFTMVLPDKPGRSPQVDAWVKAESRPFYPALAQAHARRSPS